EGMRLLYHTALPRSVVPAREDGAHLSPPAAGAERVEERDADLGVVEDDRVVVREVGPERRGREPAAREDLPLLVEDLRARRKPPPVEPSVRGEERHQAFVAAAPPD